MTNKASEPFSLTTNASANDFHRLKVMVPHWLSVFGPRLGELVIVLDKRPPSGRIAELHGSAQGTSHAQKLARVCSVLDELHRLDSRIRLEATPEGDERGRLIGKWFGNATLPIDRCQCGTPILAFIAAFEAAHLPTVLRVDCDMLFHENGWLEEGTAMLARGAVDLVEPPRCGVPVAQMIEVSTRALMLRADAWAADILPIDPSRLDPLRRVHRWIKGLPPWLALEQMLEVERRRGQVRYVMLPGHLGATLHVGLAEEAALDIMPTVAATIEKGRIPQAQRQAGMDFSAACWGEVQHRCEVELDWNEGSKRTVCNRPQA